MSILYRIADKTTGNIIGDFIIDSADAVLLSSTHELVATESLAQTLDDLKLFYIDEINKKTAQVRGRFITLEPGQETTYARKAAEAQAYIQASNPVAADHPYLSNEATATDMIVADLALAVLQKVVDMDASNVIIEAQRKRGIKKIEEALSEFTAKEERDGALAALDMHEST